MRAAALAMALAVAACYDAPAAVISSNAAGDQAVAFRFSSRATSPPLFAATRPSGGVFAAPALLTKHASAADVAVGPGGAAVATWTFRRGSYGPYSVQAAYREPGGEWGPAVTLAASGSSARAAIDGTGTAVAAWSRPDASMQVAYKPPDGPFGPAQDLPDSGDVQALATDAAGDVLVLSILSAPGGESLLQSSYRPAGGAFGDAEPVATLTAYDEGAALAMNAAGDAMAVYHDGRRVYASRRAAGGSFGPAIPVSAKGSQPSRYDSCGSLSGADVALAGDGAAFVTWTRGHGYDEDCYDTRLDTFVATAPPGAPFDPPVRLSTLQRPGYVSSVAADEGGDAAVVWGDERFAVNAAYRPAGGSFGAPMRLVRPRLGGLPDVAMDGSGQATAAWEQNDGEHVEFVTRDFRSGGAGAPAQVLRRIRAYRPRPHPRARCNPPGTRTLLETKEVRVYRNVRSGNRPKYACLLRVGRPFALDYGFSDFPVTAAPPPAIAVAGPLVAYVSYDEECGTCGGHRGLTVTDLRTRMTANGFAPLGDPDPDTDYYGKIRRLRLRRDASLAYVQCDGTSRNDCRRPGVTARVYKMASGEANPTLLAKGKRIDPRFLQISRGRVRWREGGRVRSAPLR